MSDFQEKELVKETIDGNYGADTDSRKSSLKLVTTVNREISEPLSIDQVYRYGDEASLYSIAEDSREQRSEFSSQVSELPRMQSQAGSAVEVRWVDNDDSPEDGYESSDSVSNAGLVSGAHNLRRCRLITVAFIGALVILAIVLGVTLSNDDDVAARSTIGAGVETGEEPPVVPEPNVPEPTVPEPELPATAVGPPVTDEEYELLAGYLVEEALSGCTPDWTLRDESTLNNQAYQLLIEEEIAASTIVNGGISWSLDRTPEVVVERYALMMLYLSTNGAWWENKDNWMDPNADVCTWFGTGDCDRKNARSCAVTSLDLSSNNVVGDIPPELCCLPCGIETLNIVGDPSIYSLPDCLDNVPMLVSPMDATEESDVPQETMSVQGFFGNNYGP